MKLKILKRIFISILVLTTIGSLSYGTFIAKSMYEKYNDTIKWENSSLQSKVHQIPPELAQNYISVEEQKMLSILTEVNEALTEIKKNKGIEPGKLDSYWKLYDYATIEIEKSEDHADLLTEDIIGDFGLYLKADLAIKKAYEILETDKLGEYEETFASRLLEQNNAVDKVFLKRLKTLAKDLSNLEYFSDNAITKLGLIENNVLNVDIKVNRKLTDDLLGQIEKNNLTKFSNIKPLSSILKSEEWDGILSHNQSSLEYYSWKESEKILDSLMKSNYISVSSFKTIEDVTSYSPGIQLEERENYSINKDSSVNAVYFNGEKLKGNLYVKKGTQLNFVIEYEYTENPKSEITVEYLDADGKELDVKLYEDYVGNPIVLEKDLEGYVLLEVKNELSEFPKKDSTIQIIYEKYIPEVEEPEVEESEVEEPETQEPSVGTSEDLENEDDPQSEESETRELGSEESKIESTEVEE